MTKEEREQLVLQSMRCGITLPTRIAAATGMHPVMTQRLMVEMAIRKMIKATDPTKGRVRYSLIAARINPVRKSTGQHDELHTLFWA